jgi:lycopene beta-cyclase
VLAIGVNGGRIKPSTGYAFSRVQADSEAIVQSLLTHGHPFALPAGPARVVWRLHRAGAVISDAASGVVQ